MKITLVDNIYPLTIIADRYDGCYTGGMYLACNKYPEQVAELILDDEDYWSNPVEGVGVGSTIYEAIGNLIIKMNEEEKR